MMYKSHFISKTRKRVAEKFVTAKTEEKAKELELKTKELKPWEQHSVVITIPRFDYNTSSSLLSHSHSGFLITCPIKREKSATKEAMSIFEKVMNSAGFVSCPFSGIMSKSGNFRHKENSC
ncbi:unnamed protein product [Coffea canephora]|uniref:DH200=94 genomic scaffold, scaffold_6266 n=1 Tax=Coffea canephora TaxID=49390 RepID=A0A068VMB1_COFCA|nr:unnamed protein product [Coffea canephora]